MRLATMLACGFLLASGSLLAGQETSSPPQYSRRELAGCMWKRMSANRTLSYNDASKACKEQLRGSKTDAALKDAHMPKPVS